MRGVTDSEVRGSRMKITKPLSELLRELPEFDVRGGDNVEVSGLTSDSRRVVPGMVFVAVSGTSDDGHRYVGEAIERGATVIVGADPNVYVGRRTFVRVPDSRQALSRLAAAYYNHPSRDMEVIGVTGTNGKTSVSFMLRHIIRSHEERCGLIGTVRYEIGDRHIPANRTTPDAVELQRLLDAMRGDGCRKVVMEVSSHALQQHRVADVDFNLAAFTNLTRDHLDYHLSMDSYFEAKRRLFELLVNGRSGRAAVINMDDEYGRRLSREVAGLPVTTFGLQRPRNVQYSAIGVRSIRTATQYTLMSGEQPVSLALPTIGSYNVQNSLAAVALASELGYPIESIVESLNTLPPIPGRLEQVDVGQPFSVFVDYAHTADALRRVLETLRRMSGGRILLLFGCGGGRDQGKRNEMGRIAARLSDHSWITNDNPRNENPETIVSQIVAGIQSVGGHSWTVEYDRRRAIQSILNEASPRDVVLIAGKGHEAYQEIDGAVIPFDDKLYVEKGLENAGYVPGVVRLAS